MYNQAVLRRPGALQAILSHHGCGSGYGPMATVLFVSAVLGQCLGFLLVLEIKLESNTCWAYSLTVVLSPRA